MAFHRLFRLAGAALALGLSVGLAVPAAAQQIRARLGTSLPDAHPQTLGARKFAELVAARTGGRIAVSVYSNGALGSDVQMTSALQGGSLEFTVPSTATIANIVRDFGVVGLPFSFTSEREADAVFDGPFGQALLAKLPEKNLIGLAFWENGFRNVTNSRRPIRTVEDLQGIKIRTMQNNLYIDMFNGMGSNAVPLAVTELFSALETRAVDGQENPFTVVFAQKFYDVQRYLSTTGHAYDALVLLAGKTFWDKLSEADRQAVQEAAREATLYERQQSRTLNGELRAQLIAAGMQVNDLSPEERARMRERLKPVIDKYSALLGQPLVTAFFEAIAKARAAGQ